MDRFRNRGRKGFTMIELMVVVVIVGVLAAIAIPLYGRYITNARMTEATARIGELITAAKAYAQETDINDDGIGEWPPNADTGVFDVSNATEQFTYAVSAGAGAAANGAFAVRATGIGKMAGAFVTIQVDNINSNGRITENTLP